MKLHESHLAVFEHLRIGKHAWCLILAWVPK